MYLSLSTSHSSNFFFFSLVDLTFEVVLKNSKLVYWGSFEMNREQTYKESKFECWMDGRHGLGFVAST